MSNLAGRVLVGRYRLIEPVGHGSQASVWSAEHLALATPVAVKLIDPELAKRPEALERFRREATAAAQLRSAHVVQILDHGVDHGPTGEEQPFIVMEMLEGEDLFSRLDKRHKLTLGETARIVTQVARALTRAHQAGIVHRDLKPENVFLVPNDDEEVVKVLDFGVAKLERATRVTMTASGAPALVGTPHYMSPEQIRGTDDVDFRTDLWAMGVIGFQCVVGDLPFDSKSIGELLLKIATGKPPVPSDVDPSVPRAFDGWFARSCDRDPSKRFDSARAQAEALLRVAELSPERPSLAPMSLAAPPPSAAPRPSFVPPPAAPPVAPAPAAPPFTPPPAGARPSVTPPPPGAARSVPPPRAPSVAPPRAASVPPPRAPSMAPPRAASVPPRAASVPPPRAASMGPPRAPSVGTPGEGALAAAGDPPLGHQSLGHQPLGHQPLGHQPLENQLHGHQPARNQPSGGHLPPAGRAEAPAAPVSRRRLPAQPVMAGAGPRQPPKKKPREPDLDWGDELELPSPAPPPIPEHELELLESAVVEAPATRRSTPPPPRAALAQAPRATSPVEVVDAPPQPALEARPSPPAAPAHGWHAAPAEPVVAAAVAPSSTSPSLEQRAERPLVVLPPGAQRIAEAAPPAPPAASSRGRAPAPPPSLPSEPTLPRYVPPAPPSRAEVAEAEAAFGTSSPKRLGWIVLGVVLVAALVVTGLVVRSRLVLLEPEPGAPTATSPSLAPTPPTAQPTEPPAGQPTAAPSATEAASPSASEAPLTLPPSSATAAPGPRRPAARPADNSIDIPLPPE